MNQPPILDDGPPLLPQPRRRPSLLGRLLRACTVLLVAGLAAITLAWWVENWRGAMAWHRHQREMEAAGEPLDWRAVVSPAVPDADNFARAPLFAPLYDDSGAFGRHGSRPAGTLEFPDAISGASRLKKPPPVGHLSRGTATDIEQWREFYVGNDHYSLQTASDSPAADVLKALEVHRRAIEELREAARRPRARFPIRYEDNFNALLLHLPVLKSLATLVHLRCVAHLELGQTAEAFEDLQLNLRLADSIREEPFLISQLVRLALLQTSLQSLKEGLDRRRWAQPQLAAVQEQLERINLLADCRRVLRGERAFALQAMDLAKRGEFHVESIDISVQFWPQGWVDQNKVTFSRAMQETALAAIDERRLRLDPATIDGLEQRWQTIGKGPYTLLSRPFVPALSEASLRAAEAQTYVHFALVACAAERHRLATGAFPARLEDLVPRFLHTIPGQIVEDQPLAYKRESPDSLTLRSKGWPAGAPHSMRAPRGESWTWRSPLR